MQASTNPTQLTYVRTGANKMLTWFVLMLCRWYVAGCGGSLLALTLLGNGTWATTPSYTIPHPGTLQRRTISAAGLTEKKKMTHLHIALQVGFSNDTVRIEIDGQVVFSKQGVTTPSNVGLAESFDLTLPNGTHNVIIVIPTRQTAETIPLNLAAPTYLGILLSEQGKITYQISPRPFAYM